MFQIQCGHGANDLILTNKQINSTFYLLSISEFEIFQRKTDGSKPQLKNKTTVVPTVAYIIHILKAK